MNSFKKYYWIGTLLIAGLVGLHAPFAKWSIAIPGWSLVIAGGAIELMLAILITIISIPLYFLLKLFFKK